eukprot:987652-Rhodomonas_salina.1
MAERKEEEIAMRETLTAIRKIKPRVWSSDEKVSRLGVTPEDWQHHTLGRYRRWQTGGTGRSDLHEAHCAQRLHQPVGGHCRSSAGGDELVVRGLIDSFREHGGSLAHPRRLNRIQSEIARRVVAPSAYPQQSAAWHFSARKHRLGRISRKVGSNRSGGTTRREWRKKA